MFAQYQLFDYVYSAKINPQLYNVVCDNLIEEPVMGGGSKTPFNLHTRGIKSVDTLLTWIRNIIPRAVFKFSQGGEDKREDSTQVVGFNVNSFDIDSCWGIHYNKGQRVVKHNHFPYTISFGYCINAPNNSSPFILEGEKINMIPGRLIMFLSHQYHGTLSSKVDGRCMIVGNILYNSSFN